MTAPLRQELARVRQQIDELEDRIDATESDGADLEAWVERNKDALRESIREGREALARGDFIEGTADELFAVIVREARQDAAKG
jgi:predicted  nucleic acid-binding Zn-ribbon protein